MRTPIFGPLSVSRSRNLADNQLINLFPEIVDTKDGKEVGAFYNTPGLTLWQTLPTGPVRMLYQMRNELAGDRVYAVGGNDLYAVDGSGVTLITRGPFIAGTGIQFSPAPLHAIDDGRHLALFQSQAAYLYDTFIPLSTVDSLFLPFIPGGPATFLDGFGLAAQRNSFVLWQSNLLDLTSWNALNFASADSVSDNIVALAMMRREIFVIKQSHTEAWVNAGTSGFAFGRLEGVYLEAGCVAPETVALLGETLMWLTRNLQGQGIVVQLKGYAPVPVSTQAMVYAISRYPTIEDALAYSYQQSGHQYYVISFPSGNETWVYDYTASVAAGVPMWHKRLAFSGGMFSRHWGAFGTPLADGSVIVGDYRNGNIYKLDEAALTDAGQTRRWVRSWRALPKPTDSPSRFSSLRIDMQTGIGVPDGTSPNCMLRYSDDGGNTWSTEHIAPVGPPGATAQRVMFHRLGSTRRGTGLDRIFELSSADQFPVTLIGAELR
jgi:hypothetical protein